MTDLDDWRTGNPEVDEWVAGQHAVGKHGPTCPPDCHGANVNGQHPPRPSDDEAPDSDERPSSSWLPVDLAEVLDGSWQPPKPAQGRRTDGAAMFYPGKSHSVVSESEAGKTWLGLAASLDAINNGDQVVFIDFEDDQGSIASRLLTMGARRDTVRQQFHYIHPEGPLSLTDRRLLSGLLLDLRPVLAIVDGVTEAMELHGLDPNQGVDISRFAHTVIDPLTVAGAAAVALDHPTKDGDNRRYATGSVHKLNGLSGAQFVLEPVAPFGIGLTGRSRIKIAKDRPAQVRINAEPGAGMYWFGDLVMVSHDESFVEVTVEPPHGQGKAFRPTVLMERVSSYLATHPGEADRTQRQIRQHVQGKDAAVIEALDALVAEEYVTTKEGIRKSTIYTLAKPFAIDGGDADE